VTGILVTGGSGFIGSHLVDALARTGRYRVTVLSRHPRAFGPLPAGVAFVQGDLADAALVRRALLEHRVEGVYHAAWSTTHETSLEDVIADVAGNVHATLSLLEACRAAPVRRVVFLSSGGTVYGLPDVVPVPEGHPTNPISAYGITKLAVEKYLKMYRHLYGLESVILRPSVPYGPRQNPERRQGAVAVFTHRALQGRPAVIWGDGSSVRDYYFVEDMLPALLAAMEIPFAGEMTFNLAGERGYTLLELVAAVEQALGVQLRVEFQPARPFDVPCLRLCSRAAESGLSWRPVTSLPDGIRRTAEWMVSAGLTR
jgi:UDP-glucose 4-epimerase